MTPPAQSTLANDLRQAAAIKAQMLELLGELEQTASAHPIERPGAWRHHPIKWAAEHLNAKDSKNS